MKNIKVGNPKNLSKVRSVIGAFNCSATRLLYLGLVVVAAANTLACSPDARSEKPKANQVPHFEPWHQFSADQTLTEASKVPGGTDMAEIVRVGSRAMEWFEKVQENVPVANRVQLWTKAERKNNYPDPDSPSKYNPDTIAKKYSDAMAMFSGEAKIVLEGTSPISSNFPSGMDQKGFFEAIKKLNGSYSRASRWIHLYPYHNWVRKDSRDFRPWLSLAKSLTPIRSNIAEWSKLGVSERELVLEKISAACAINGTPSDICLKNRIQYASDDFAGPDVLNFLENQYFEGKQKYDHKFEVWGPHHGVKIDKIDHGNGQELRVTFYAFQISTDVLSWIQDLMTSGWDVSKQLSIVLEDSPTNVSGAVKVKWKDGATANVNGVGGNIITMDANTPKWLELTSEVMIHEFGHVMGFTDCYVEFWEPSEQSFYFYALDATNRMCALSGDTLQLHTRELVRAYSTK